MDASGEVGTLATVPLTFDKATALHLNADAAEGQVVVSVLDEAGRPIQSYEQSSPVAGDVLRAKVAFVKPLAALSGHTVRLKFQLDNMSLYSFWFE